MTRVWGPLPLRVKGLVAIAIPLAPLLVTAVFLQQTQRAASGHVQDLERAFEVRTRLASVLVRLLNAEAAARGYQLTGDRAFAESDRMAVGRIGEEIAALEPFIEPAQRERLRDLAVVTAERLRLLQTLSESVERDGPLGPNDPRQRFVTSGEQLTRQFLGQLRHLTDDVSAVVVTRAAAVADAQRAAVRLVWIGAGCGVVGGVAAIALFTAGVARRVEAVAANADRLAAGQPLEPVAGGSDEVGVLAKRLQTTAELLAAHERGRVAAEAGLRAHAEQVQDLFDHAPCGYHSLDADGRFIAINQTELDWLGYSREEVVGRLRFPDLLPPDCQAAFAERFPVFKKTGVLHDAEFELLARDGRRIPVSVSATAVRGPNGEFLSTRSSLFDITARRAAEREIQDLNAELRRRIDRERALNHELEAFSYSVSHDLRAPLRHVAGFVALLERKAGDQLDAEGRRLVGRIADAAARMGRLIDDLLVFSRMGRSTMAQVPVDLAIILEEARREVIGDRAQRKIAWTVHPLPIVHGDPGMLRVVFENLLSNAVKYTSTRLSASIEVGCLHPQNGEATVYVRDNGVGFDMQYVGKLFGVFERLHPASQFEGTGIGLANVKRVIERHGGRVWAEAVVDGGATFFLTLPTRHSEVTT